MSGSGGCCWGGAEWSRQARPVNDHDFEDKQLGKVAPYGVYDLTANAGWVNVGTSADTAVFAVESIRRWWQHVGSRSYPGAAKLLITADSGGSNGSRLRLWKTELTVRAMLDTTTYEKGIKIPDKEMKAWEARHLHRHDFHGDWNYTITAEPATQPT